MSRSFVVNLFWLAFGIVVAAIVIGLVTLWPSDGTVEQPPDWPGPTRSGEVDDDRGRFLSCARAARVPEDRDRAARGGPRGSGRQLTVIEPSDRLDLDVGDQIRVSENRLPPDAHRRSRRSTATPSPTSSATTPLFGLALAFAVLVVVVGRWKGLRALVGLAIEPRDRRRVRRAGDPRRPLAAGVALVGSLAVMLVTLTSPTASGRRCSLRHSARPALCSRSASAAVHRAAHLTGFSSEEAVYLGAASSTISIRGLLLAGFLIAALGVLDDLTVTQASIVLALRRAKPELGFGDLFRSAVAVGHDHIAATVNTLVLAYAGASLPILLIFSLADTSFGTAVTAEAVATAIVATLVGSIGLIAAVPVTTA